MTMMIVMASQPRDRQADEKRDRFRFPSAMRVRSKRDFQAAYEANVRVKAGPLLIYARPNDLGHSRLGLAIARRVGHAVRRHRLKRHLRESFRLLQHDLPAGYDFIISAQPHDELSLAEYQELLVLAAGELDRKWQKKA
jgi:ribonuclease P protein component